MRMRMEEEESRGVEEGRSGGGRGGGGEEEKHCKEACGIIGELCLCQDMRSLYYVS